MKGHCTILDIGYRNNTRKSKIAEALMIKVIRPSLNEKEKSVELKSNVNSAQKYLFKVYSRNIALFVGPVQI